MTLSRVTSFPPTTTSATVTRAPGFTAKRTSSSSEPDPSETLRLDLHVDVSALAIEGGYRRAVLGERLHVEGRSLPERELRPERFFVLRCDPQ